MIEILIGLVVFLVIAYIVYLAINFVTEKMGLPPTIRTILFLVLGLIAILYLLDLFGLYSFNVN